MERYFPFVLGYAIFTAKIRTERFYLSVAIDMYERNRLFILETGNNLTGHHK